MTGTAALADEVNIGPSGLKLGGHPDFSVSSLDVKVAGDVATVTYGLRNKGAKDVALTGVFNMGDYTPIGTTDTVLLPSEDPENPVKLTLTLDGAPLASTPQIRTYAIDTDETADLRAAGLPLIPFGPAYEKALAALSVDQADRLAAQGLLSVRANPPAKREAKWTLESRRALRLNLKAAKTTLLGASFTMTKARSKIGPADQSKIDDLKGTYCVNDKTRKAMSARLKAKGSWTMTEYSTSLDGVVDGVDNPPGKFSVQKPGGPDTIVAFCGMNEKTAGGPVIESGGKPEDLVMSFALFDPS